MKPEFLSFFPSLFILSPQRSSPPNTTQVRKTRRGKNKMIGGGEDLTIGRQSRSSCSRLQQGEKGRWLRREKK
jgi:hypothetical protein